MTLQAMIEQANTTRDRQVKVKKQTPWTAHRNLINNVNMLLEVFRESELKHGKLTDNNLRAALREVERATRFSEKSLG